MSRAVGGGGRFESGLARSRGRSCGAATFEFTEDGRGESARRNVGVVVLVRVGPDLVKVALRRCDGLFDGELDLDVGDRDKEDGVGEGSRDALDLDDGRGQIARESGPAGSCEFVSEEDHELVEERRLLVHSAGGEDFS